MATIADEYGEMCPYGSKEILTLHRRARALLHDGSPTEIGDFNWGFELGQDFRQLPTDASPAMRLGADLGDLELSRRAE